MGLGIAERGTWTDLGERELSKESLRAVLDNRLAVVRIRDFATPEECERFARAAKTASMKYYSVQRKIGYIGLAQYEYRWNTPKEHYFRDVHKARAELQPVLDAAGWDPIARLIERVQAVWDRPVSVGREEGLGEYYAGIVRAASEGVDLHADYAPFNSPAYAVRDIDAQLGWNFFAEGLPSGGQTTVHNAPWSPVVQPGEIPQSYNLPRDVVAGARSITYDPTPGDVVIFNARNPHEISGGATLPGRERISIGSFIGRMPGGSLVLWS
jgi:hypothetical protein